MTRLMLLLLVPGLAAAQLKVSANGRYLTEQDGTPVLLVGESSWDLFARCPDYKRYIDTLAANNVNFVCARLTSPPQVNGPSNLKGNKPWIGTQTFASQTNEVYWTHVDSVMDYLLTKHIYVQLFPDYLGYDNTQGFQSETGSSTAAVMKLWGQWVGQRYGGYANVIWGIGGDTDPSGWKTKLDSMISGIRQYSTTPMAPRDEMGSNADTHWRSNTRITLNYAYQYADGWEYRDIRTCAARSPRKPFIWAEGRYWHEAPTGVTTTGIRYRSQIYWTVTWQGCGFLAGDCPIWSFGNFSGFTACNGISWTSDLSGESQTSLKWAAKLFNNRNWWTLIPDTNNTVLTAGMGSYNNYDADIATCGYASDSTTIIVYVMRAGRAVTVTSSRLKGDSTHAWWFNPFDGSTTDLGVQTKASHTYTPPAVDRVLVLDAKVMHYPAPGIDLSPTSVDPLVNERGVINGFALAQNYPNPFNSSTTISYYLPGASRVRLKVFDTLGHEIATLVDGVQEAGRRSVQWDASGVASGVYLCRLSVTEPTRQDTVPQGRDWQGREFSSTMKLLLLR